MMLLYFKSHVIFVMGTNATLGTRFFKLTVN